MTTEPCDRSVVMSGADQLHVLESDGYRRCMSAAFRV